LNILINYVSLKIDAQLRTFRNLIYPKGISQPSNQLNQENKSSLGLFANRMGITGSNSTVRTNLENLRRKSANTETFNMKKVKLSDDLAIKNNVQQKLSSFGTFN